MRLGVLASEDVQYRRAVEEAVLDLRSRHPATAVRQDMAGADLVLLAGDDRFFLDALRDVESQAVLLVGDGFLAETTADGLREALERIVRGEHWTEPRMRLDLSTDDGRLPPVLNEVALNARKGSGFVRYSLRVNGERIWRDGGDGVIVSTPTGSTGYGLSAGGPIVMENSEAIVVVPICSATGQRPLVVPSQSAVQVTDIESRWGCDAVLDGSRRVRVTRSGFTVRVSAHPARFVRLGEARYLRTFGRLRARRADQETPVRGAPSAKYVFRLLSDQGPMTEKQIVAESGLAARTVRSALAFLVREGFVRRSISLRDAREAIFSLSR